MDSSGSSTVGCCTATSRARETNGAFDFAIGLDSRCAPPDSLVPGTAATGRRPLGTRCVRMPDVVRAARLRTAYKGVEYLAVRRRLPSRLAGLAVLDVGSGICQQAALMSEPAGLVI